MKEAEGVPTSIATSADVRERTRTLVLPGLQILDEQRRRHEVGHIQRPQDLLCALPSTIAIVCFVRAFICVYVCQHTWVGGALEGSFTL